MLLLFRGFMIKFEFLRAIHKHTEQDSGNKCDCFFYWRLFPQHSVQLHCTVFASVLWNTHQKTMNGMSLNFNIK
jgi:hypothetical protein